MSENNTEGNTEVKNNTEVKILDILNALSDDLMYEDDEIIFSEGKEEVLRLLDIMIHKFGTIDYHYLENIEFVREKQSLIDIKLEERILKGKLYVKTKGDEGYFKEVIKGMELLINLEHQKRNRVYGIKGIYTK
jgi:hypothetical protein